MRIEHPTEQRFTTTHWSVVLSAREPASLEGKAALGQLCESYWYPVYAFFRRKGHVHADAEDLTQELFCRIANGCLAHVKPEMGLFRTWLLRCATNLASDRWNRSQAIKRGGGQQILSLDEVSPEQRYDSETASELTPDEVYDQQWALAVFDRARQRLREECIAAGRSDWFDMAKPIEPQRECNDKEIARSLGVTISAIKSFVNRKRARFRELLQHEVAHTLRNATDSAVKEELRCLAAALRKTRH